MLIVNGASTHETDSNGCEQRNPLHHNEKNIRAVGFLKWRARPYVYEMPATEKGTDNASDDQQPAMESCAHVFCHRYPCGNERKYCDHGRCPSKENLSQKMSAMDEWKRKQ